MSDLGFDLSNLTLEFEVISYALRNHGLPEGIQPQHFMGVKTKWLAHKIEQLGTACSMPILLDALTSEGREGEVPEFQSLLERLANQEVAEETANIGANRLRELAEGRRLVDILSGPTGVGELVKSKKINEAIRALEGFVYSGRGTEGVISQGDLISDEVEILATIDRSMQGFLGIPTLIVPIDQQIGGLLPQEVGLFAGGTGQGKSIALLDVGMRNYELADRNVIGFSLEMRRIQQELRQVAWATDIEFTRFRGGHNIPPITDAEKIAIQEWFAMRRERENIFHWVDVPQNVTATQIEKLLIKAERETRREFDLVLIDYLGIMAPVGSFKSRIEWDAQAEIAWNVHNLARRTDKPIWSAAQKKENISNRERQEGSLRSIGLSYMIAQPVDIVLVFTEHTLEGYMEVNVAKGRDVSGERIRLQPELRFARLHRMFEDESTERNTIS